MRYINVGAYRRTRMNGVREYELVRWMGYHGIVPLDLRNGTGLPRPRLPRTRTDAVLNEVSAHGWQPDIRITPWQAWVQLISDWRLLQGHRPGHIKAKRKCCVCGHEFSGARSWCVDCVREYGPVQCRLVRDGTLTPDELALPETA